MFGFSHAQEPALRHLGLTALGVVETQPPREQRAAQVEFLTVFGEPDHGDVEPLAILDPETEGEPVRQVDDRLVLHLAARHLAGQPVVTAGRIGARIVDAVRIRLGRSGTAGEAPVSERAERLAQRLLCRVEAFVDQRPAAQDRRPGGDRVAHRSFPARRRDAHLTQVANQDVGAAFPQLLGMASAIDADDKPKAPATPSLDAGKRVLDHGGASRLDPEPPSRLEEDRGVGLPFQPQLVRVHAIDLRVEEFGDSRRFEHVGAVARRRDDCRPTPPCAKPV